MMIATARYKKQYIIKFIKLRWLIINYNKILQKMKKFSLALANANGTLDPSIVILVVILAILLFTVFLVVISRYKKCPSDKIMVIYGKVSHNSDGTARSAKCVHGGASFVWPVFQSYEYLDLTPLSISVDLTNALSRQNIRVDVPSRFTVGISTEPGVMQNAAERLLDG